MKPAAEHRPKRYQLLSLVLLAIGIYVLLPQFGSFKNSLIVLRDVEFFPLLLAELSVVLTLFSAALTYRFLSRKPLKYHRTVLVATANMFTNRLLPAGTGSIATFYLYLRRNKHSFSQATSVIAVNNFLGITAHVTLLGGLFVLYPAGFSSFTAPTLPTRSVGLIIAGALLVVSILFIKKSWHQKFTNGLSKIYKDIYFYKTNPLKLIAAFTSSLSLTLFNVAALWLCLIAVGVELSPVVALAVFTISMIVGTATPTPGGVGGAEAGLLAGLIGFQVSADKALAAVIVYRLLSYWLTILLGMGVYAYITQRAYLLTNN